MDEWADGLLGYSGPLSWLFGTRDNPVADSIGRL